MNVGVFNVVVHMSVRLSSVFFIPFSLFCSLAVFTTILSSSSLIHSSASIKLLLLLLLLSLVSRVQLCETP